MSAQFSTVPSDSKPFLKISQDAVDVLESITAAEKAQAVPYCQIWQIDPKTGEPVHKNVDGAPHAPLSLKLVEPPSFGSSVDGLRFRDRPPVSLERVTIKTENPRGIINYRTIELAFMVHRPDVIFGEPDKDVDTWSSVLVPGMVHAMEYGWRASKGVKNGILNGDGFTDLQSKPPVSVPALSRIRFTITNYTFNIQPDGQIAVTVTAFEDGELNLRRAVPGLASVINREQEEKERAQEHRTVSEPVSLDPYSVDGKKVVAEIQRMMRTKLKKLTTAGGLVRFEDLANVLFADVITESYSSLGYDPPSLVMGYLNDRCGKTTARYGGKSMSNQPIGEFLIPLSEVEKRLGNILKNGEQITFYNFIKDFLFFFRDSRVWDTKLAKKRADGTKQQTIPEVAIRSIINKKTVVFYIFDVKREFTKFSDDDRFDANSLGATTREQVRKKLREKGVPIITFLKGNSYVVSAQFESILDDQIKTIFMRRALNPTRAEIQDANIKKKEDVLVDPRQLIYSSSIKGEVTMLGNFAFDLFALVWLDFGVSRWDGPFYVMRREDNITSSDFQTKLEFVSSGEDPLGTQGRASLEKEKRNIVDEQTVLAKKPEKRSKYRGY